MLDRAAAAGAVPRDEIAHAKSVGVPHARKPLPVLAPHSADQVVGAEAGRRVHRLTIDAGLQKTLQDLARERARALGPQISVAILAVDNETGEVRARVGSADYFDERRAGQVDMTQALRSPGSTLKPFIYGLAFEDGLLHPETLIDDRPVRYGNYTPENFDLTFQGTVTVRRALQMSLNVPAIAVLGRVGVSRLSARLTQTGAALVLPKGEAPGLAMGLGGVGIKLSDLVMLYTGLARLGSAVPLIEREGQVMPNPRRLLDPVAAWYVGNILIGAPPPDNAMPGRIAFKTGTSYGYRDAWAVGYDGRMTIGVWVGRADGAPVPGLFGRALGGADPVRRLRAQRQRAGAAGACAQGRGLCRHQQIAAAAATFQRRRRRERRRPSRRASCSRPTARASNSSRARPRSRSRSRSPAAPRRSPSWSMACRLRRKAAGAPCSSSPMARASCGSPSWMPAAPPTASASACNNLRSSVK